MEADQISADPAKPLETADVSEADLFRRLIEAGQEAHARGHFDTAYHALAAALDLARDIDFGAGMLLVERLADDQLAAIDQTAPDYQHSTASALRRGHSTSIFSTLARQARVAAAGLRSLENAHGAIAHAEELVAQAQEIIAARGAGTRDGL